MDHLNTGTHTVQYSEKSSIRESGIRMDTVYALHTFWALHLVNLFYVFCMFYALRESDVHVKDIMPAAAATISKRF